MRAEITAAIDRRLDRLIRSRARRRHSVLRLLPASWLDPLVAPRVRRLRMKLIVATLGFCLLLAAALLYVASRA
jgi:hypothetical protein